MNKLLIVIACAAGTLAASLFLLANSPVAGVVVLVGWFFITRYFVRAHNFLVSLGQNCDRLFHGVSVAELRQQGIIPRLQAFTANYSAHERQTLLSTVQARGGRAANLAVLFEAYPNLKANQAFLQLFHQLVQAEDAIYAARTAYNSAAANFNSTVKGFPMTLAARAMAFGPRPFIHA